MSKAIKIKKGLDIKLKGKAALVVAEASQSATFAIKPTDFQGLKPKLSVKPDDVVKAGSPLFYDKANPDVKFASPVSGKVSMVNRGERRKILEIVVESDGKFESESFASGDPKKMEAEAIKSNLLNSGLWPFIIQRPFGIIANPAQAPRDIFVSAFDSAPLAPDMDFVLEADKDAFQDGICALTKLSEGKVFLGVRSGSKLADTKMAELVTVEGPHPAGNVGIQLHNTKPLNKGEVVWTVSPMAVVFIGRLFKTGKVDLSKTIALTGSEVSAPQYYKTVAGASIASLISDKTNAVETERVISGNVLTGTKVDTDGFLGFYDNQITVIPEGAEIEPFGWATPGYKKFSASATFLSKLLPKKEYTLNANLHGGLRAFVVSEQYEKVLPMDILPVYLLKAIITNDFDKMEQLGIYEVIEEDLALCEYACTSKIEVQEILRNGINTVIKELA